MSVLKATAIILAAGMVTAVSAVAASPESGHSYRGTGRDFMNNAPKWADEGTRKISFQTSSDGMDVIQFRGAFSYYCGAGTSDVTEKKMAISKSSRYQVLPEGQGCERQSRIDRVRRCLQPFDDGGSQASVSYLVDYVFTGKKVSRPFSTSSPRALGCASWVRGQSAGASAQSVAVASSASLVGLVPAEVSVTGCGETRRASGDAGSHRSAGGES